MIPDRAPNDLPRRYRPARRPPRAGNRPGAGRIALAVWLAASIPFGAGCARPPRERVVVVGLDGATFDLILPWVREGKLPVMAGLIAGGAHGELLTPVPPSSAPAWTTAVTGVNPGKHGIYGFIKASAPDSLGNRSKEFYTSRDRGSEALWGIVGRAGKKVALINIPLTSPPDSVAGFMISGFPHASTSDYAWPEELKHELLDYRLDGYGEEAETGHEAEFLANLADISARREKITLRFLKEKHWDLFWVVFTETDRIQHYFWRYMDPSDPHYDPAAPDVFKNAILNTYQDLDRMLGKIVALLDDHTTLLVVSDHGFGPTRRAVMGETFVEGLPREGAYQVFTTDNFGAKFGLRAKASPADPAAYRREREDLLSRLGELRDPSNGAPLLEHVWTREELYQGPYVADAPDVIGLERPEYLFLNWGAPGAPLIVEGADRFFSGFHRMEGILMARGPDVARGATVEGAKLEDLTPTILALLRVPLPDNLDGHPLETLFGPGWAERHHTGTQPAVKVTRSGSHSRDAALEAQLRSVGYIR